MKLWKKKSTNTTKKHKNTKTLQKNTKIKQIFGIYVTYIYKTKTNKKKQLLSVSLYRTNERKNLKLTTNPMMDDDKVLSKQNIIFLSISWNNKGCENKITFFLKQYKRKHLFDIEKQAANICTYFLK